MPDEPKWMTLQKEWNSLVPAAQAAGIPRIRLVKIGAEAIRYREEKLTQLKSQLRAAGVVVTVAPTATPGPQGIMTNDIAVLETWSQAPAKLAGLGAGASMRHDLPLANYDIIVTFKDQTQEVLKVQARDPLSAIRLASTSPCREWEASRLLAINSIHWRRSV